MATVRRYYYFILRIWSFFRTETPTVDSANCANVNQTHCARVLAEVARQAAASILDGKGGSVLHICAGLGRVVFVVQHCGKTEHRLIKSSICFNRLPMSRTALTTGDVQEGAMDRGHPQVGGACVEHHGEGLRRRTQTDLAIILSLVNNRNNNDHRKKKEHPLTGVHSSLDPLFSGENQPPLSLNQSCC